MKKIKLFLCVALFGAMSYGAFTAYQSMTMSEEERFLLANIEALTNGEPGGGGGGSCGSYGWTGDSYAIVCNVSREEAMNNFNWWSTPYKGWCCDSCYSTWYCGNGTQS